MPWGSRTAHALADPEVPPVLLSPVECAVVPAVHEEIVVAANVRWDSIAGAYALCVTVVRGIWF